MKKRRTVYQQYDYEAVYQEDIDNIAEQQMLDMLKEGKRQVYATKEIRAGEQLEVEIYPEFTRGQKNLIPDEGRRKKQREAQRNLNEKNSRKQCERVINENFTNRDIWATFTYTDDTMPDSMEQAQKNMQRYIKKLNYHRKKAGLENARYVYVTECSKKGRWHHHIVLDGDIEMDVVEKLWTLGKRNETRRLQKDKDGLTGMARYITKSPNDKGSKKDDRKGQKKWVASKNLRKPQEKKTHYKVKARDVDKIVRNENELPAMMQKLFAAQGYEFKEGKIRYNDFNGRFYIYARLWNPDQGGADHVSERRRAENAARKKAAKDKSRTQKKGNRKAKTNHGSSRASGSGSNVSDSGSRLR